MKLAAGAATPASTVHHGSAVDAGISILPAVGVAILLFLAVAVGHWPEAPGAVRVGAFLGFHNYSLALTNPSGPGPGTGPGSGSGPGTGTGPWYVDVFVVVVIFRSTTGEHAGKRPVRLSPVIFLKR